MNAAKILLGVVGGSVDVAADPDPNTTAPNEDRCFTSAQPGSLGAQFDSVWAVAHDGTSLAIRLWMFDRYAKRWVAQSAAVTATTATGIAFLSEKVPLGAKLFAQVTTNTGNVKSGAIGTGYGS